MPPESPQTVEEPPEGRFLTDDEALEMKENLAQTNFGMNLAEFTKAWRAGGFDDDQERCWDAIGLAMLLPEYWTDDWDLALDEDPD